MATSHNKTIEFFGLNCPDPSSKLYICEGATNEFIGCCTSDPCKGGIGICPKSDLRTTSFDADRYDDLKPQKCDDSRGSNVWWTCIAPEPPFMGCCETNPCGDGCPTDKLVAAVLTKRESFRKSFLDPEGAALSSTASVASSSATSAVSSSPVSENDDGGLGTGAIAGIAVGSIALVITLIASLAFLCWRRRQNERQAHGMVAPGQSHGVSEAVQPTPMGYNGNHFRSTSTLVPYYPSSASSDYYNKPSPSLPSPESDTFHMNSAIDHNYGYHGPMVIVPEMDGADRYPYELGTSPVTNRRHVD
ncbi:unnamed protein product [Fusarium equiseti]|uniref:Uncharacterized protein n=1 Tax=Fusarium equiseti TaxID=61235 RepID=A0A8J2J3L4_FUSEQ|nr:unnamed protein product [Fusarium equiseti]